MNGREKFLATMDFDLTAPPPLWEMAYWVETVERWSKEGMLEFRGEDIGKARREGQAGVKGRPVVINPAGGESMLGLDIPSESFPGEYWIFPKFERRVLEDRGERQIIIDEIGVKMEISIEATIPRYLEWPVTDRETWEIFKSERLDAGTAGRYPANIDELVKEYAKRTFPLRLGKSVGFFGPIRYFLGEIRLMTAYYDDPDLMRDIVDYMLEFYMQLYAPILSKIEVDWFTLWEDMCYNTGPLISPATFREFMLPAYKKFTAFLRDCGVKNIIVDTDGDCSKLTPLFLEGGVSGIYPFEVAAGMDVVKVREQYPKLQMIGGIDKRPLIEGKQAIDEELDKRIPAMLAKGGYIPYIDHHVPPDISLENYIYYRGKLNSMIERHYA